MRILKFILSVWLELLVVGVILFVVASILLNHPNPFEGTQ